MRPESIDQGAIKHVRGNALINYRATCDAHWDWHERAFFKNQKIAYKMVTKKCKQANQKTKDLNGK
jgi:hypothetical protein